jgi:hypothetical protein
MVHHHPLADARFPGIDGRAERHHDAAGFVPGDNRAIFHRNAGRLGLAFGAAVLMQVAAAHAGRLHLDHHLMGVGGRVGELHQFQPALAGEHNAAHGFLRFLLWREFERKKPDWQRAR